MIPQAQMAAQLAGDTPTGPMAAHFTSAADETKRVHGLYPNFVPYSTPSAAEAAEGVAGANRRFAPPNQDYQDAFGMARNVGDYKPYLRQSAQSVGRGTADFANVAPQSYMSPYESRVTNRISEMGNRNFMEKVLPALDAKFIRMGQHGSAQHRKAAQDAAREMQSEISALQGQFMHEGYKQAADLYSRERQRDLEAAKIQGVLAQDVQTQRLADINSLVQAAEQQRAFDQEKRDFEYEQFLARKAHPLEMANFYTAGVRGMPYSTTSTRQNQYQRGGNSLNSAGWGNVGLQFLLNQMGRGGGGGLPGFGT